MLFRSGPREWGLSPCGQGAQAGGALPSAQAVGNQFFVDGKDVTELIRTPEVNAIVSEVAAIKEIRKKLVDLQRAIGNNKKIILDGRDTGTTVFPNADVKIFLLASPEIRAKRRLNEYNEKNTKITYEEVLESIKKRDYIDSTREESPLVMASDAKKVDSSDKNKIGRAHV